MRLALLESAQDSTVGTRILPLSTRTRPESGRTTLPRVAAAPPHGSTHHARLWLGLLSVPLLCGFGFFVWHGRTVPRVPLQSREARVPAHDGAPVASTAPKRNSAAEVTKVSVPGRLTSVSHPVKATRQPPGSMPSEVPPSATTGEAPTSAALASTPGVAPAVPVLVRAAASTAAPPPVALEHVTATPTAPQFKLALAAVAAGSPRNAVGATASSVARTIAGVLPRITACYSAALPTLGAVFEGTDTLHLETDGAGVITDARLDGPLRGGVAVCAAAAVRGHRIANVDTGRASADIPLSFRAH